MTIYSLVVVLSHFWTDPFFPCLVLTVASWPTCRFLRRQVWYSHLFENFPQFVVIHTIKDFGVGNKTEVGDFLELSCFFDDPVDVGSLISGSSAFSKSSLYIWKFLVHVLLKSSLKDFEHYLASMWNEHSCMVVWTFFVSALLWDWNENWPFPVLWPLLNFPNLLAYLVQHFHSIIFQDLKYQLEFENQLEFHHLP